MLSIDDAWNVAYGFTNSTADTDTRVAANTAYVAGGCKMGGRAYGWWLRSPGELENRATYVGDVGALYFTGNRLDIDHLCARHAFKLNPNSVLFTSAAVGVKISAAGGSTISQILGYTGNEWKATLPDSTRSFTAKTTAKNGNVLTVAYSGAKTDTNGYTSFLIADSACAYTHYVRIA